LTDPRGPAGAGEPGKSIAASAADDPWNVRQLDSLRIGHHEVPYAQAGKVLHDERTSSSYADDSDLLLTEHLLTPVAEEPSLAVIGGVSRGVESRLGVEEALRSPGNVGMLQHNALATRQPDVTGDSVGGEDEGTDGQSFGEIEERRVTPLVGGKVVA